MSDKVPCNSFKGAVARRDMPHVVAGILSGELGSRLRSVVCGRCRTDGPRRHLVAEARLVGGTWDVGGADVAAENALGLYERVTSERAGSRLVGLWARFLQCEAMVVAR
ncbi:hypothetical protein [Streptomyces inhibens]|uniref:hypothetical protein n=1 Tax=Streptomyces inhibens TaxID=2293571 RepID=UPI001EE74C12|nr:hypothetical protein [Streptomyces inhibens]UKY53186.1 hypothetical protein KI385_33230 [Streptomyces inhibens]